MKCVIIPPQHTSCFLVCLTCLLFVFGQPICSFSTCLLLSLQPIALSASLSAYTPPNLPICLYVHVAACLSVCLLMPWADATHACLITRLDIPRRCLTSGSARLCRSSCSSPSVQMSTLCLHNVARLSTPPLDGLRLYSCGHKLLTMLSTENRNSK